MNRFLASIAKKFWPELETMSEQRRLVGMGDVIVTVGMAPLALVGLAWLTAATDLDLVRRNWPALLLLGSLIVLFNRINYFIIIEIRTDRYGSADGSFGNMIQWSGAFLLGPTALWLVVLWTIANFWWNWRKALSTPDRWNQARNIALELASNTLGFLIALSIYQRWGGVIPISGLTPQAILPAMGALVIHFIVVSLILGGFIGYAVWVQNVLDQSSSIEQILRFMLMAVGLPFLAFPFGILAAGLYVQNGLAVYLFFIFGLFLVAVMARQLSWAVESSRQQSRQLQKLEHLGRDILNSPPDVEKLAELLDEHVPTMFPPGRVVIWLSPDQILYRNPPDWPLDLATVARWVTLHPQAHAYLVNEDLPWEIPGWQAGSHSPVVLAPILDVETSQPVGCIYLQLRSLAQPWDRRALTRLFPAVQSLAAQVASTLYQAQIYEETLAYQQAAQELSFAGRIQASFLPGEMPRLDGWELAVTLRPARETSGDFFDFIPLSDRRIGILIADVADKGLGAALYMALSRTLIRTYAFEYESQPDIAIMAANERILGDARANLFITAFYAVLDPDTGTMTYCNAGHHSPFLISQKNGGAIQALPPTGMPIGIELDAVWGQASVQIEPGDVLLLYTDGIPDAQNLDGEFYREKGLLEAARESLGRPAHEIQGCILERVEQFVAGAPQFDDITLLVLMRDPE
jgi:serine phosphatase RsbU (regulator of sigma subunit)